MPQEQHKPNGVSLTMTGEHSQLPNNLWVRVGMVQVTVVMGMLSGTKTRMAKIGVNMNQRCQNPSLTT